MPTIEQITPKNAAIFKRARLQALKDSPRAFGSTYAKESQYSEAEWLKRATDWSGARSVGYLAMESGEACGIVGAFLDEVDPHKAHLISMWVAPAQRRNGMGRALIKAIEDWATTKGVRLLRLTVTSSNLTAIEFYRRHGFAMTGDTEPYPNDPALVEYEMICSMF
jgi:ribosomal protein S18 acetylase RimI-like enzyme